MRKFIAAASSLALVASLGFASPALADSPNSAFVDKDNFCGVSIATPNGIISGFGPDSHTVQTKDGNTILTCHFDDPTPPAQTLKAEGFTCGIATDGPPVFTTDTKAQSNPGGNVLLVCKFVGKP